MAKKRIGKNAKKKLLRLIAARVESSASNGKGFSLSKASVHSGADAKRHGAAMVAARREQWEGAHHDGYMRHGRTFIRRSTAQFMNGRARLDARWSAMHGITPKDSK